MKYFDEYIETKEIRAESILFLLDEIKRFRVSSEGVFYRNYSNDILSVKKEAQDDVVVRLSRDSLFHLLPQGFFFTEDMLVNLKKRSDQKEKIEQLKEEKEKIKLFFQPFDTQTFLSSLELEKKISEISSKENEILYDTFFSQYEIDESNEYIKKIKPILPYLSEIKTNLPLMEDVLICLFDAEVSINMSKPTAHTPITKVLFTIYIEKLTNEEYQRLYKKMEAFFEFFYEWFLSYECEYEYEIKDNKERFILDNSLTLEYNTQFL